MIWSYDEGASTVIGPTTVGNVTHPTTSAADDGSASALFQGDMKASLWSYHTPAPIAVGNRLGRRPQKDGTRTKGTAIKTYGLLTIRLNDCGTSLLGGRRCYDTILLGLSYLN